MPGQNFEVAAWLRDLGMERYTQAFLDAEVTPEVLRALTEADLRELGLPLGPRKIVLHAIRRLASPSATRPVAEAAAEDARPGATPSPRPERRLITVMFIDLVGSTALSIRLDPEDFRELIGAYQVRVTAAVERAGGFVAKYMGDGVLAYFGYPHAHEDDPERAIRAALELTASPQGLERPAGTAIEIRAGIATGLAVVGDLLGRGAAQEWAVVGETPNLAARLQAVADPNSVVIAETTRRMVGGLFDCRDLGPVQAKGFPAPIRAYRVLGPAAVASRFEALHASPAPLVGREEEMRLLLRRWEQAREGQGQVLVLSGEAGVGKSRLLAAVQEKLHGESPSLLRYFCSPHGRDSPFHPVIAQLERAAGFSHGDAPEVRRAKLEALLAQTSPTAKDLALLAEMLSLPLDNRSGSLPPSPHRKREQTFAVLLRGIERLSGREPVLMVFEDVHWIDPSSREFLDLVVGQADRLRILLLVTCRPEFDAPWTNRPHVTALSLQGIGQHEAANLVRLIAGTDAIPDELVTEIVERTDGMPLFIEELTKAVLEAGADRTIPAASPAKLAIPATLHASLMARLDRLDSAARAVAQAGAVIGREVPHELLVVVAGLDREELAAALDQLAAVELIHRRGEGPELELPVQARARS